MKERLVSRVTADFFLRYAELLGRRFDGSFQRGVIFVAIVQGNISHIGHLSEESLKYADSDTTPPDNMRRPIPVNAVAASLNMPYETVRRHINALIESGYCQKVRGKGIIVPAHVLEAPENRAALKNSYDQMRRMVLLLRRAGVTFEDDKWSNPPSPFPPLDRPRDGGVRTSMTLTLVSAWKSARERLTAAGVDSPVIDARLLLEAAANATRLEIVTEPQRALTPDQETRLEAFLKRREGREPVSHILGRKGFWKIMLRVTSDVLTPRPDTETLMDIVLPALAETAQAEILDLGVGSGAILLAILAERAGTRGLGIDVSEAALEVARENAALLNLQDRAAFSHGDWTEGLADDRFDVVVSNPPYIPTRDIAGLDPEVRDHEPHLALDGGPDGLDAYRRLAPEILRVLKPGGLFAVEIGPDQTAAVMELFKAAGAIEVRMQRDLSTRERVVAGLKKPLGYTALNR